MTKTRVMLVDDHALCRSGLTELLEHRGNMNVVAACGEPRQALEKVQSLQPELLVLDMRLGTCDGLSVLRQMRSMGLETPVVMLTMSDSEEDMAEALRAGVRGYLLKDMEPEEVIDAIQRVVHGELVIASAMTLKFAQLMKSGPVAPPIPLLDSLTDREHQVLSHVASGQSNKQIALEMDISHNTVKLHVRHIMEKLKLHSRVEAAVFATENQTPVIRATSTRGVKKLDHS